MCRDIGTLANSEPPANEEEIRAWEGPARLVW